jgi:hypothetical protein
MPPLIARIAPSRLTDGLVTKPAKTKVKPKARMIGHAVGAGISIIFVRLSVRANVSLFTLFSISASNQVNDGEDHNPNRVHEVPIKRQDVDALGMFLLYRTQDGESHYGGQRKEANNYVKAVQPD